ncbi:MAG: TolC family protein [Epsilonproteobacteria bacterium]|nr:TolC family protein [Campylobacterota bacterium]
MALNALTRPWLLCSLLLLPLWAQKGEERLLSSLKEESLRLQSVKNAADSTQLALSWISPVSLGYVDSRNNQYDTTQRRRELTVTVDQPIFKSGGIWEAIQYAKASRKVGELGIEQQRRALIKEVIATLFNFRKNRLQIQKQKLLIANDRIDILRKKEQYLSGDLDSGFLDQAILQKNRDSLTLYTLQDTSAQLEKSFKDLSDADPSSVKLPHFTLMPKARFLKHHIDLALQKERISQASRYAAMTLSRYLPTLSVQASYIKPYENNYLFSGGSLPEGGDDYYTYGFRISMPLDVTAPFTVESARAQALAERNALLDKRREADNAYEAAMRRIEAIDRMIALAREDAKLYASLLKSTREQVEAGEKTDYDLQTMANSLKIRRLDQEIYEIQKQLVLLELYAKSYEDRK